VAGDQLSFGLDLCALQKVNTIEFVSTNKEVFVISWNSSAVTLLFLSSLYLLFIILFLPYLFRPSSIPSYFQLFKPFKYEKCSFFRNRGEILFIFKMFPFFLYLNTFMLYLIHQILWRKSSTLKSLQYLHIFSKFSYLIFLMFR